MFQKQPLLNAKGLLTAVVATLLTGQALAETAGRVTFVTGEVVAISSDGQRRVLAKSELVNSGERLETGKGRLQIRFTDGSFISLQPNTVFGLDNYTFARAKPKEGALLFNFVRGGMRTISGAIGKINRANYTVKTPVGTIGIRGTGYVATQEPNGRLLVTVNKGIVNVSNEFGSSNINVGQTFQIEKDKAPEPAQQGVAAEVLANKPAPKSQDTEEEEKKTVRQPKDNSFGLANDANNPDLGMGEQTNANGQLNVTIFPFVVQSIDGVPHLNSFGSLLKGSSGKAVYSNVLAAYNNVSADGKTVGNLVGLISTTGMSEEPLLLDTRRTNTPLQFSGVKQIRSLSFGEWTNGQAASIDNFINITGLNLSTTQFMPYIVGSTTSQDLGNNQRIRYSLADTGNATPARAANSVGQLTKLNISIDLNLVPLVDVDMAVTLDNTNYTASLQNKAIHLSLDKKLTSFVLNGSNDNFFASSSDTEGKICANNSCPVTLSAFFSGVDMGAVYEIARANNLATIGGVAALSTSNSSTITLPKNRLPTTLDNSYTALFSNNAGINITPHPVTQLAAVFDNATGGWRTGFLHTQTANGVTSAIDVYGVTTGIDGQSKQASAATISQVSHLDNVLSWGVWSNGLVDVNDPVQNYALSGTQQVHYILGLPTTAADIPLTRATHAVYTFQGGTTPTVNTAGMTGSIANSSYLDIDFGSNETIFTLNLDMTLLQGTATYMLNATGQTSLSRTATNAGMFNFNILNVTLGAGNPCNTLGCTASASGFLAGSSANFAGLNYSINAVSPTLNNGLFITTEGVAAFKLDPNATVPVSTLANTTKTAYRALLTKQINDNPEISVSHEESYKTSQVSASFDPETLVWKTGSTPQAEDSASRTYGLVADTIAASASKDVRHYKQTLSWGRWLNSSVNYGDANASVKLAANDNVHYIIGVPAASLPSSGIATYRFVGSTTPTGTLSTPTKEGSPASTLSVVTGVSVLNDSKVTVNFGKPTSGIGLDLGLSTLANGDLRMTGNANLNREFSVTNLAVTTGTGATAATTACSACSANGFFAGTDASMIGLNYEAKANIAGGNASISGVAAFEK